MDLFNLQAHVLPLWEIFLGYFFNSTLLIVSSYLTWPISTLWHIWSFSLLMHFLHLAFKSTLFWFSCCFRSHCFLVAFPGIATQTYEHWSGPGIYPLTFLFLYLFIPYRISSSLMALNTIYTLMTPKCILQPGHNSLSPCSYTQLSAWLIY